MESIRELMEGVEDIKYNGINNKYSGAAMLDICVMWSWHGNPQTMEKKRGDKLLQKEIWA